MDPATMMMAGQAAMSLMKQGQGSSGSASSGGGAQMGPMAAMMAAQAALSLGKGIAALIPGKQEKAIRRQLKSDERLLKQGHGITSGQRQEYMASANQAINANTNQMLANMARGSAQGMQGSSGQQYLQQKALAGGTANARRQVASDVNRIDRAAYDALKASVQQQRANIMALNAQNLEGGMQGAQGALAAAQPGAGGGMDLAAGEQQRAADARQAFQAYKQVVNKGKTSGMTPEQIQAELNMTPEEFEAFAGGL